MTLGQGEKEAAGTVHMSQVPRKRFGVQDRRSAHGHGAIVTGLEPGLGVLMQPGLGDIGGAAALVQ
jgi:hypothetical protein